ncbi:MAG: type II toxin-antitoxin system HicB family antitoxin [bacterium]
MLNNLYIQFNIEIWKEGDMYVAYVPQLDISSCGKTVKVAKTNVCEAVEIFLDETKKMGTFNEVLEEAGFSCRNGWKAPKIISCEQVKVAV